MESGRRPVEEMVDIPAAVDDLMSTNIRADPHFLPTLDTLDRHFKNFHRYLQQGYICIP